MNTQIWNDGVRSVEALLAMVKEHPGSSSSKQAALLLNSAIYGKEHCDLNRMRVFDSKNLQHALNIIRAVGTHSGEFSSHVNKTQGESLQKICKFLKK